MEVLGLLLRVACVFGLLFLALHLLRRMNGLKTARRASPMQVLGSTRIGKGAALTVVRIGDSDYVLGVTDHTVTLITPATPTAEPARARGRHRPRRGRRRSPRPAGAPTSRPPSAPGSVPGWEAHPANRSRCRPLLPSS